MEIKETNINGLVELYPKIFHDERGYFFESYNVQSLKSKGFDYAFVQDNQSFSKKGVLRGLHFQRTPFAQGKLVSVVQGKVLDVAVDIRPDSDTFGQHYSIILDEKLRNMLFVPEGFAHGFVAMEDSIFSYKCTNYYNKELESGIIWNDKKLDIDWMGFEKLISEKDLELPSFDSFLKDLKV